MPAPLVTSVSFCKVIACQSVVSDKREYTQATSRRYSKNSPPSTRNGQIGRSLLPVEMLSVFDVNIISVLNTMAVS